MSNIIIRRNKTSGNNTCMFVPAGLTGDELSSLLSDYKKEIATAKYDITVRKIVLEVIIPITIRKYGTNTL